MSKKFLFAAALTLVVAACSNRPQPAETERLVVIDVENAIGQLEELKLSQLGTTVRYVPLETGDSCFVGNNPQVQICGDHILVTFGQQCLCFDKSTGRFVNTIGHVGEDPEGYASPNFTYNESNGLFYFVREPDQLLKYDAQGRYQGRVQIPTPPARPTMYAFCDSLIAGYYLNMARSGNHNRALLLFDESGRACDSVASQLPALPPATMQDIEAIHVWKLGLSGILLTRFSDGSVQGNITSDAIWTCDGGLRYKEEFSDTVFTLRNNRPEPVYAFHTGRWHFPAEARTQGSVSKDKLLPLSILETPQRIFFQCARNIYENNPETLNGIYDKQSGITRMGKESAALTDDVNGFLPFRPLSCSTQGEFVSLVWPEDILPWLDEHPEAKNNPAIAPLLQIGEEDNPVVIIVQ